MKRNTIEILKMDKKNKDGVLKTISKTRTISITKSSNID